MAVHRPRALVSAQLQLAGGLDGRFFALLQAIADTGSIHAAAATAGLSYRGARLLLETAGNLAHAPLLDSATGGRGGGGSRLTPAAQALLTAWRGLQARLDGFLQAEEACLTQDPAMAGLLRRLSMKTTARNQFAGTVTAVDAGPVTAQVSIALKSGDVLVASMTAAAAQRLGVQPGMEALALVKASAVVLVTDFAGWRLSARNQLAGTISRIEQGQVSSLVVLTLPGGDTLSATVTNDAVGALGLKVGQPATAVFKAYAVMVAVAAA